MESDTNTLIQELEKAINEAIYESDRIADVVADLKHSGYDVCLLLETTIGLMANRGGQAQQPERNHPPSCVEIGFTEQDRKFLEALKITAGD